MVQLGSVKFWVGETVAAAPPLWLITIGEAGLILCTLGFFIVPFWRERPLSTATVVMGWMIGGLAFLFLLVLSTHVAVLTGRYLYPLFAPIAVGCAIGANRLGKPGRWLFSLSTLVLAVAAVIGLDNAVRWSTGL